ncbi:hypothetical protein IGE_05427 [Bacillus cereus HuB1-1]|nr:hypothetical protein IGE_05427 [Bacillus cereus HuB1-1]
MEQGNEDKPEYFLRWVPPPLPSSKKTLFVLDNSESLS